MDHLVQVLSQLIFPETGANAFIVLDGASVTDLAERLYELQPEHRCLYFGKLSPDMAEVAPYLVHLQPGTQFADWVLEQGWGKHWGIFAHSYSGQRAVYRHFRRFLRVCDSNGKALLFRYYDPRVLRAFLPTCNPDELQTFFGPIEAYYLEAETPNSLLRFRVVSGVLEEQNFELI